MNYPDQKKYNIFRKNLINGWNIGLQEKFEKRLFNPNPRHSITDLIGIGKQICKWHKRDYIIGPISRKVAEDNNVTLNMLFGVPKPDGSTRPILNLSDTAGTKDCINNHLNPELTTVEYVQQKELIYTILAMGKGAYLWAKDLENGYNNVPICESDIYNLGFTLDNKIYLYQVLPMGLSSSPKIFTDFMHFPIWAIKNNKPDIYYTWVHPDNICINDCTADSDIVKDDINNVSNTINTILFG